MRRVCWQSAKFLALRDFGGLAQLLLSGRANVANRRLFERYGLYARCFLLVADLFVGLLWMWCGH